MPDTLFLTGGACVKQCHEPVAASHIVSIPCPSDSSGHTPMLRSRMFVVLRQGGTRERGTGIVLNVRGPETELLSRNLKINPYRQRSATTPSHNEAAVMPRI